MFLSNAQAVCHDSVLIIDSFYFSLQNFLFQNFQFCWKDVILVEKNKQLKIPTDQWKPI
jgi:hypothetical protein